MGEYIVKKANRIAGLAVSALAAGASAPALATEFDLSIAGQDFGAVLN